jgi:hypothetical protein
MRSLRRAIAGVGEYLRPDWMAEVALASPLLVGATRTRFDLA